ncbi:carbohydrate kinase family protein [Zhihengliuella sp. ISTPL4]|uniref:carbohydrate kinase family protein n=1 Tax=Zhihengliuella sp. ISTPL4 TaxID=2058657 RepID=UPI000C7A17FC|nr:carbohydrate kinase family protein [Zhihengliuella sp. ISTPL4]
MPASVFLAGPVSWNRMVLLDRLPDPVPHMQFARASWETVGGTSAGKALSLRALERSVLLRAIVGEDEDGLRVRAALEAAGVVAQWTDGTTERHLNLMTAQGDRVSLYLSAPAETSGVADAALAAEMTAADAVVLDLAAEPRRLLPLAAASGSPLWVDVHDYDGHDAYHRPFLAAAAAVFCNADRLDAPVEFLRATVAAGADFAVCTLGADGAVAVGPDGIELRVPAVPATVLDTNGAGDAFFAGVLDARLGGADIPAALTAGARSAAAVLGTRHLHPLLDPVLGGPRAV